MNLRSIATSSVQHQLKHNDKVTADVTSSPTISEMVSKKRQDARILNQEVRVAVIFCQIDKFVTF